MFEVCSQVDIYPLVFVCLLYDHPADPRKDLVGGSGILHDAYSLQDASKLLAVPRTSGGLPRIRRMSLNVSMHPKSLTTVFRRF